MVHAFGITPNLDFATAGAKNPSFFPTFFPTAGASYGTYSWRQKSLFFLEAIKLILDIKNPVNPVAKKKAFTKSWRLLDY
jgi:hypothetical protein